MLFMTNGYSQDIYGSKLTLAGDHTLTDQEKCLVVSINMTAASKTVILGVADGDAMTVINIGSNAFTVKNIAGDTGVSLDADGMVTVIGGGDTADAAKFITGGGGGGGGGASSLKVTITQDGQDYVADKTIAEIAAAFDADMSIYAVWGQMVLQLVGGTAEEGNEDFVFEVWSGAEYDEGSLTVGFARIEIYNGGIDVTSYPLTFSDVSSM